jgi:hypothetical protein
MSTGHEPYNDIPECEVKRRFEKGIFPNDFPTEKNQSIYAIIKGCWTGELESMKTVVTRLEKLRKPTSVFQYFRSRSHKC